MVTWKPLGMCALAHLFIQHIVKKILIWYLAVPGLSYSTQVNLWPLTFVATRGIFSCAMRDLVPWPGIKPGSPTLEAWSLSHQHTFNEFLCARHWGIEFVFLKKSLISWRGKSDTCINVLNDWLNRPWNWWWNCEVLKDGCSVKPFVFNYIRIE